MSLGKTKHLQEQLNVRVMTLNNPIEMDTRKRLDSQEEDENEFANYRSKMTRSDQYLSSLIFSIKISS